MKKLTDICDIQYGYAFDSKCFSEDDSYPQLVRIRDVKRGFSETYYSGEYPEEYILHTGDLLVGMDGEFNIARWKIEGALLNQRVCKLTAKEGTNEEYLRFAMVKALKAIEDKTAFVTVKHLSAKELNKLELDIPSLEEQDSRAESLAKLEKIIGLQTEELRKLDDLIKARFVELFGESGKQVPLTDYVWFQEGPGVRSVDFTSDGTILLTGSNINDNEISFGYKSDRFISNELATGKYAHFMCDIDDILAVTSAIAPEKFDQKIVTVKEDKKYCLNTGIIRFKPNKDYLTIGYFREFLKTDYFKHQVMSEMRGIAQMHFGPSHLKQMTILLPDSMEKQIEFEQFVKQVDKSKVAVQKALDETQLLFDSLMHKYFG